MSNEAVINAALDGTMNFLSVCVPILLIWLAIAFFCQKKIIRKSYYFLIYLLILFHHMIDYHLKKILFQ